MTDAGSFLGAFSARLRLLLVRHAEAALPCGAGDRERPLTARGQADAGRLGAFLRKSAIVPGFALVSPAKRARETLDAILQELPREPEHLQVEEELYHPDLEMMLELVRRAPQSAEAVLIVAHNPGLGEFARSLAGITGIKSALPSHLPAPCLVAIGFTCGSWKEVDASSGRLAHYESFSSLPGEGGVSPALGDG